MPRMSKDMQIMERTLSEREAQLADLDRKRATVQAEVDLLRRMIAEAKGEDIPNRRAPRSNVKRMVLSLLEQVGNDGLNAASAVEMADQKGVTLERNTVSSLLSRLKHDETVVYDGNVYKLKQFAEPSRPTQLQGTQHKACFCEGRP